MSYVDPEKITKGLELQFSDDTYQETVVSISDEGYFNLTHPQINCQPEYKEEENKKKFILYRLLDAVDVLMKPV